VFIEADQKYHIEHSINGFYLDGVLKHKYTNTTFASDFTQTLYIFALNNNNAVDQKGYVKIYSFKIYEGETLVRDFIPAIDEKGVICLYDNVTKAYFYNQGSGEFQADVTVKVGIEPLDYTVTFTVNGEPHEVASVKNGNMVNAPVTEPINNGLLLTSWKMGDNEVSFPFTPTENCEICGEFNLYQVVRRLTTNDIAYRRGFVHHSEYKYESPPYTLSASNRAGCFSADIPIEYGYTYKFEFETTSVNSQCAICFLTQNSLDKRASGNSFEGTYYDTGWQTSGFEYEVPETYNGSPIRTVVLSFRMSPNNESVVNGFIQSVTISRKIANGGMLNE
jgi:hypothetical protein